MLLGESVVNVVLSDQTCFDAEQRGDLLNIDMRSDGAAFKIRLSIARDKGIVC